MDILRHPAFDLTKRTVLYIHGYLETQANESINVVVNAYIQRGDHNIILLDWADLAEGNYFVDAIPNAKQVSKPTR